MPERIYSEMMNTAQQSSALSGLIGIVLTIVCILIAWWALQSFRIDVFMRNPKGAQARLLLLLLSVVIGHGTASFILDYLEWSLLLKWLV